MKKISLNNIKEYRDTFNKDKTNLVLQRSVIANGIYLSTRNPKAINTDNIVWTHEIDTGEVQNQSQTGRCWLFAAMVLAEKQMAKNLNIPSIKLSKPYLYFYDKLEMANTFYQNIINSKDEDITSRKVQEILKHKQSDGGIWAEAADLIEKYGVVPESIMPETDDSAASISINVILNEKLTFDAKKLRQSTKPEELKQELLAENYKILAMSFGTPPESFTFEYKPEVSDDNKPKKSKNKKLSTSPIEFWKEYGGNISDFVDLDFRTDYKKLNKNILYKENTLQSHIMYGKEYTSPVIDFNSQIIQSMKKQLDKDEPIWFWWDNGKQFSKKYGVIDSDVWKYNELYNLDFKVNKDDRGLYRDVSQYGSHATAIVGYHEDEGKITHWKVKNSWGSKVGKNGYLIMNTNYLEDYVLGITLRKKYLPKKVQEIFDQKPVSIQYWQ